MRSFTLVLALACPLSAFQFLRSDNGFIALDTERLPNPLEGLVGRANSTLAKRDIVANWINSNNQQSLFTFTGSVFIGTPAQRFKVIFDSGSFQLWVRSSNCMQGNCIGKSAFNAAASSTFADTGSLSNPIQYADGTRVQGPNVLDTVAIWGKQVVGQFPFVSATTAADIPGVDGVLGVARPYSQDIRQKMLFYQLMDRNTLSQSVFSWYIDSTSSRGQIIIGGVDPSKSKSSFQWTDCIQGDAYWSTTMGGISGPFTINVPSNLKAVFDTGTSLAYTLPDIARQINAAIGATIYSQGGVDNYRADCNSRSSMPILTFTFGSTTLQLSPNEYIYEPITGFCMSAFVGMTIDPSIGMLIGNVLLRRWYTVFDMGNNRLGFADANR